MKRRAFIGHSLSAFTVALIDYKTVGAQEINTILDKNLLEQFADKFNLAHSEACWSDSLFTLLYNRTSQSFQKSDYRLLGKQTFILPALNLVMVPLELNVASLGCIDRGFLFYVQYSDSQWLHAKSMNSYEVATILQTADLLCKQLPVEQVKNYLLPCGQSSQSPTGYATLNGRVEIEVKVTSAGAQTNVQVWEQQFLLLQYQCLLPDPSTKVNL